MTDPETSATENPAAPRLRVAVVLRVREGECEIVRDGSVQSVRFAKQFPTPHTERVAPGNLVATAFANGGTEVIVWRWYDAVVLGRHGDSVRLWEPAHGQVAAQPRPSYVDIAPGSRAYLSAGLPGAEWWVAGPVVGTAEKADVELDEVEGLYTEYGLWDDLL